MGKIKHFKKNERKALTIAHPNSRKAARLAKQTLREEGRKKQKIKNALKQNMFGEKLLWFKENLEEGVTTYSADQANKLFLKYLSRFDEELDQIKIKHSIGQRKNRQHASREDAINMTVERERNEFTSGGIEMVDITHPLSLEKLRGWDGNMGFLNQMKMKFFTESFFANQKSSKVSEGTSLDDNHKNKVLNELSSPNHSDISSHEESEDSGCVNQLKPAEEVNNFMDET